MATLSTADLANKTIGVIDDALHKVSKQRADLGAYYNRLETASKGLMTAYENIQALKAVFATPTWPKPW